jgi:UTP-glucose-1-phosphate uridylyltransferase
VLSGAWEDAVYTRLSVSRFTEKPDREYYGVFGQYVLTPEVFDALQKAVEGVPDRMARAA